MKQINSAVNSEILKGMGKRNSKQTRKLNHIQSSEKNKQNGDMVAKY